jgi:hypothetical protein
LEGRQRAILSFEWLSGRNCRETEMHGALASKASRNYRSRRLPAGVGGIARDIGFVDLQSHGRPRPVSKVNAGDRHCGELEIAVVVIQQRARQSKGW